MTADPGPNIPFNNIWILVGMTRSLVLLGMLVDGGVKILFPSIEPGPFSLKI